MKCSKIRFLTQITNYDQNSTKFGQNSVQIWSIFIQNLAKSPNLTKFGRIWSNFVQIRSNSVKFGQRILNFQIRFSNSIEFWL